MYFVAPAGAGKTFGARYLVEKYGYVPAKFAYPVYHIAQDYFGMKDKDRRLLQVIGTDAGRNQLDPDIWVQRFSEDLCIVQETRRIMGLDPVAFVVDDVRFPNEHEALKSMGWVGIYLDVPPALRLARLEKRDGSAQEGTLGHESETKIEEFRSKLTIVDASGSLEDMYARIEKALGLPLVEESQGEVA